MLDIARYLLENIENYHVSHEVTEKEHKLQQLKSVLEMYADIHLISFPSPPSLVPSPHLISFPVPT